MVSKKTSQIAVIGSSDPTAEIVALATAVGRTVASMGAILICGGLGGVMQAAARGAKQAGGLTVGILPDYHKESANPFIDVVISSGLGHARNIVVAASGDLIIALPGSHGTRSEISIALKLSKPVIGVTTWGDTSGMRQIQDIEELKKVLMPFF